MAISTISDRSAVTYPGAVLQVANNAITSGTSMTTTSWTPVGLEVTITPTSATSKLHITMTSACAIYSEGSVVSLKFSRVVGGSMVADSPTAGGLVGQTMGLYISGSSSNNSGVPVTMEWFDTPNTTQPTTYRVYMKGNGAFQIRFGTGAEGSSSNYDVVSTISAMEIAA